MTMTQTTWIAVADGSKASLFEFQGLQNAYKPVDGGHLTHTNKPTRDLVTTKRGRVFQSADGSRSAMEHRTDPHEHEKNVFAREVAAYLEDQQHRYDRLVLAAAPAMLGELRRCLDNQVRKKVCAELDKDLTNLSPADLLEHFNELIRYIGPDH